MMNGLILFAHGARDPRWAEPFEAVLAQVRRLQPAVHTRLAFLELMQPSLPGAAETLVAEGCGTITVQPMFLGTGGHLRRDLPLLLDGLRTRFPQTTWRLNAAIGESPLVMEAMARSAVDGLDVGGAESRPDSELEAGAAP